MKTKTWITWTIAAVSFGFIVWLILRDEQTIEALRRISALQIVVLLTLQVIYLIVESRRLEIVIEDASNTEISSYAMLSLFSVGRILNLLVPQAGNVYRGVRLNRSYGIAVTDYAGALGAFVWLTVVLSLLTSGVVLGFTQPDLTVSSLPSWIIMVVAGILVSAVPIVLYLFASSALRARNPDSILGKVASVVQAAADVVTNPILVLKFIATWLATLAVIGPMYIWTFAIVDVSVGLGAAIAIYGLVQVASFVVITPGNIGILDIGFAGLAVLLGVPVGAAAAAAGLVRASGIIATAGTAMVTGWSDLKDATTHRDSSPDANIDRPT